MKETIDIREQLALLAATPRSELSDRWSAAFECAAPRYAHTALVRGALAWHLQMQALNRSLDARAFQQLTRPIAASPRRTTKALAPGTRLLRQWQGKTHAVTVAASGYEYEGVTYRSLSAIARKITGSSWSGPLFFGLHS